MRYYYFLLIAVLLSLASCSKDDPAPVYPDDPEEEPEEPINPEPAPVGGFTDLHIDGRYLKNAANEIVNIHGYTQTFSRYFNNNQWGPDYDASACVAYNKSVDDRLRQAGWSFNFVRLHMDPYWTDDLNQPSVRFEGHERFSIERFKSALENVFIPMLEYYIENGEYVVMRPPGVCPEDLEPNDSYYEFLVKVWRLVAEHPKVKNNMKVMFELANEPVRFKGDYKAVHDYFQGITDVIRKRCDNIIWVPGLSWQQDYKMYAQYPIEGKNIGYAVHCYPGWYGSPAEAQPGEFTTDLNGNEDRFRKGWKESVGCVGEFAPIIVTEIDWAPLKYNINESGENKHLKTWGSSTTSNFGRPFKKIADEQGNVSWLLFTTSHEQYCNFSPEEVMGNYTFMNDPEACPWPIWHWFRKYAGK